MENRIRGFQSKIVVYRGEWSFFNSHKAMVLARFSWGSIYYDWPEPRRGMAEHHRFDFQK